MGHAFSAMLLTRRPIHISLGKRPNRYHFKLGQLRIGVGPSFNPALMAAGYCSWPHDDGRIGHWGHVFVLLSGPLASWHQLVLYSGLAFYWQGSVAGWLMQLASWMAFSSLALTIIPMRYPAWMGGYAGMKSDALAVVDHLRAIRAARQ